jgi:predicted O-methyltransferase YrrM
MVEWHGDELVVDGQRFRMMVDAMVAWMAARDGREFDPGSSRPIERGVPSVCKSREMIDDLADRIEALQPRTIVELGIFTGGSTALLAALAPAAKVVAIELKSRPAPELTEYIERTGTADRVRPYYGVDQGDRARLREILAAEFGDQPIDLVVDDASHLFGLTRDSLEVILPAMRPGGQYIIEDWCWAHADYSLWDEAMLHFKPAGMPLTMLIVELLMAVGSSTGVVSEIHATGATATVVRGPAVLDREAFALASGYRLTEPFTVDPAGTPTTT